jgi:hypothetical protein
VNYEIVCDEGVTCAPRARGAPCANEPLPQIARTQRGPDPVAAVLLKLGRALASGAKSSRGKTDPLDGLFAGISPVRSYPV